MASRIGLMLTVALVTLTAAAQGLAAEWLLLSREGGCTALDVLSRKLPNLPLIQTPDQFEAYLYAAGLEYSHKLHANGGAEFHEFFVPSAGLAVVLVLRAQCQEILPGPR